MSTLKAVGITSTNGSYISTPREIKSGCAAAWCRFNGRGTLAVQASHNIGTITDNGTGRYNFQFTNPIAGFHAVCGSGGNRTATTKQAGDDDDDVLHVGARGSLSINIHGADLDNAANDDIDMGNFVCLSTGFVQPGDTI
jgi:hypothetical protein